MAKVFFVIGTTDVTEAANEVGADYTLRVNDCEFVIAANEALLELTPEHCGEAEIISAVIRAAVSCGTVNNSAASEVYDQADQLVGVALSFSLVQYGSLYAGVFDYAIQMDAGLYATSIEDYGIA